MCIRDRLEHRREGVEPVCDLGIVHGDTAGSSTGRRILPSVPPNVAVLALPGYISPIIERYSSLQPSPRKALISRRSAAGERGAARRPAVITEYAARLAQREDPGVACSVPATILSAS